MKQKNLILLFLSISFIKSQGASFIHLVPSETATKVKYARSKEASLLIFPQKLINECTTLKDVTSQCENEDSIMVPLTKSFTTEGTKNFLKAALKCTE